MLGEEEKKNYSKVTLRKKKKRKPCMPNLSFLILENKQLEFKDQVYKVYAQVRLLNGQWERFFSFLSHFGPTI